MQNNVDKTIKGIAKEAKKRLKTGFWDAFKNDLNDKLIRAENEGISTSKVVKYYTELAQNDIKGGGGEDEEFYQRVKKLLEEHGEVSNILGRLTDKEYYDSLDYNAKQKYTLDLSEKYRKALIRYKKEQELKTL